jgi:hypothetical protein
MRSFKYVLFMKKRLKVIISPLKTPSIVNYYYLSIRFQHIPLINLFCHA